MIMILFLQFLGEIFELRQDLIGQKEDKRKEALKGVISAMTIGIKLLKKEQK